MSKNSVYSDWVEVERAVGEESRRKRATDDRPTVAVPPCHMTA